MLGSFGDRVTPAEDGLHAAWVESRFDWDLVNCPGYARYVRIDHSEPGEEPHWSTPAPVLSTIARIAAGHTSTASEACFGVWEGHGWAGATAYWINMDRRPNNPFHRICLAVRLRRFWRAERRRQTEANRELDQQLSVIPRLELQIRSYYLLSGPVDAAPSITTPGVERRPQVPDLWWPKDRAWFVATDTDLDWTVVGGSEQLAKDLVEALPAQSQPIDHR